MQSVPYNPLLPCSLPPARPRGGARASDQLIINRQRDEAAREEMLAQTRYYARTSAKADFEQHTTAAIARNRILQRFETLKAQAQLQLEHRREKLAEILNRELDEERLALMALEETNEHRLERMRLKAQQCKDRREQERLRIVEEKNLQRWRNDCDELRQLKSKQLVIQVNAVRMDQIGEQKKQRDAAMKQEQVYAAMWEADRQKKVQREQAEAAHRRHLDEETLHILDEQMAQIRASKAEQARLRDEEQKLMLQQAQNQKLQAERDRLEERRRQHAVRMELETINRAKIEQQAKEVQRALEFDMYIVQQMLSDQEFDKGDRERKKEAMRAEVQQYQSYLRAQHAFEKQKEAEMEKLQAQENDRAWRKRAEKWQKEQRARDKLMREVIEGRNAQIQENLMLNQQRQQELISEQATLAKSLETGKLQQIEEAQRERANQMAYKQALRAQIQDQQARRAETERLAFEEYKLSVETEQQYQTLLRRELAVAAQSIVRPGPSKLTA